MTAAGIQRLVGLVGGNCLAGDKDKDAGVCPQGNASLRPEVVAGMDHKHGRAYWRKGGGGLWGVWACRGSEVGNGAYIEVSVGHQW